MTTSTKFLALKSFKQQKTGYKLLRVRTKRSIDAKTLKTLPII